MPDTRTIADHPCQVLRSGRFELDITTQVGPRIIGGFIGDSANLFAVLPAEPMPSIPTGFILYGGHRLWHSPEASPRSYAPDNEPVAVSELEDGEIEYSSGVEELTGIEKSISIKPLGNERFQLRHRLVNRTCWPVELAPWALSQMAPGGRAVIPQYRAEDANPFSVDRSLHLWPYSDLADPRLKLGSKYIMLCQDTAATTPCKIGVPVPSGWAAYVNGGVALVKLFTYDWQVTYPDHGCNVESYTCADFCELETLGALVTLQPGQAAELTEVWWAIDGLPPVTDEASVDAHLLPRLNG